MPFSRGIMASSILATGIDTGEAYRIASVLQAELATTCPSGLDVDELAGLAERSIRQVAGDVIADRYRAWRRVRRDRRPVVLLIAGASGVGKSTLATRLAVRLGITQLVTTDTIREVLRTVIPPTVSPELHLSTYETVELDDGPGFGAFERQASIVASATSAVVERLVVERRSVIVEGAHLVPSSSPLIHELAEGAVVVPVLLAAHDVTAHRARLAHRRDAEPGRAGGRSLDRFDQLRALHDHLLAAARQHGVAVIDAQEPAALTTHVVDAVLAATQPQDR